MRPYEFGLWVSQLGLGWEGCGSQEEARSGYFFGTFWDGSLCRNEVLGCVDIPEGTFLVREVAPGASRYGVGPALGKKVHKGGVSVGQEVI